MSRPQKKNHHRRDSAHSEHSMEMDGGDQEMTPISPHATKTVKRNRPAHKSGRPRHYCESSATCCGCIPVKLVCFLILVAIAGGIVGILILAKVIPIGNEAGDNYNWQCFDAKSGSSLFNLAFYNTNSTNNGIFMEFRRSNGTKVREQLHLKGASWSGFETKNNLAHGLWSRKPESLLDFLVSQGFNAIRLPFHMGILNYTTRPNSFDKYQNSRFSTMSAYDSMEYIIKLAGDRGLLVMLGLHSFGPGTYKQDGLWYNDAYSEASVQSYWTLLADMMKNHWNVIGADLKNEPWQATWGTGDLKDWKAGSERLGSAVLNVNPNWLVFVEGVFNSPDMGTPAFYGENLAGVRNAPVNLTGKVIYSPHVYGPSVEDMYYFSDSNFPQNMPQIWEKFWGYLVKENKSAIAVGEWGTEIFIGELVNKQTRQDTWAESFVNYLISLDARDNYIWQLNPDGIDTIGLLKDDWSSAQPKSLNLAKKLQPFPTKLKKSSSSICYAQTA